MRIIQRLKEIWCAGTHGGGIILRDPSGRINWQCVTCGRWSTPVSKEDEANILPRYPTAPQAQEKDHG